MDMNTFLWMINGLTLNATVFSLNDFLEHIGSVLDLIKRPGLLLSGYLLFHGSQESLWIEESSKPE